MGGANTVRLYNAGMKGRTETISFGDNDALAFGDAGDVTLKWDGTQFEALPVTDDTGAFNIGDGTTDMDFKVFMGSTSNHVLFDNSTASVVFTDTYIDVGTSGSPNAHTAGTPLVDIYSTCSSTSGATSAEPFYFQSTMTGAGGVGGRARFHMTTNVALGGWSNALKASVTYGATGSTTGLGSALLAEMDLSAGTTSGTYAPLEIEINCGSGASTGTATSFWYANINGADAATVNSNGYLFELGAGVVDTAGGLFEAEAITATNFSHVLRCRIAGTTYYIGLHTDIDFTT